MKKFFIVLSIINLLTIVPLLLITLLALAFGDNAGYLLLIFAPSVIASPVVFLVNIYSFLKFLKIGTPSLRARRFCYLGITGSVLAAIIILFALINA